MSTTLFDIEYLQGQSCLEKTRHLKNSLEVQLANAGRDERERISTFFIRDWGGITRHSAQRSVEFIGRFEGIVAANTPDAAADGQFSFDGISSWSKYLSLACPDWAFIYDTRIAYALNAIQYILDIGENGRVFPMPSGRNKRIKFLQADSLLLANRRAAGDTNDPRVLIQRVDDENVYLDYLELINGVHDHIGIDSQSPHDTEMLLFSIADSVIFDDLLEAVRR